MQVKRLEISRDRGILNSKVDRQLSHFGIECVIDRFIFVSYCSIYLVTIKGNFLVETTKATYSFPVQNIRITIFSRKTLYLPHFIQNTEKKNYSLIYYR